MDPATRVVYVDHDPVVVAHGQAMLAVPRSVEMVEADLLRPEEVLGNERLRRLIDLDQPVALLMMFVLHLVPDDARPHDAVERYRSAVAPGSVLAVVVADATVPSPRRHPSRGPRARIPAERRGPHLPGRRPPAVDGQLDLGGEPGERGPLGGVEVLGVDGRP